MRPAKPNRAYGFGSHKHASPSRLGSPGVAQSRAGMRVCGHTARAIGRRWVASYPQAAYLGSKRVVHATCAGVNPAGGAPSLTLPQDATGCQPFWRATQPRRNARFAGADAVGDRGNQARSTGGTGGARKEPA